MQDFSNHFGNHSTLSNYLTASDLPFFKMPILFEI